MLDERARRLRKSSPGLSYHKAIDKALDPSPYARYQEEKNAGLTYELPEPPEYRGRMFASGPPAMNKSDGRDDDDEEDDDELDESLNLRHRQKSSACPACKNGIARQIL